MIGSSEVKVFCFSPRDAIPLIRLKDSTIAFSPVTCLLKLLQHKGAHFRFPGPATSLSIRLYLQHKAFSTLVQK